MNSPIPFRKVCHNWWFRSIMFTIAAVCITVLQGGIINDATAAIQATYYISPSGNDANAGTLEAPFKTIKKNMRYCSDHELKHDR